jgi:hypothetical protein
VGDAACQGSQCFHLLRSLQALLVFRQSIFQLLSFIDFPEKYRIGQGEFRRSVPDPLFQFILIFL